MKNDYQIELNFLPAEGLPLSFRVFRKLCSGGEARPDHDTASYSLPVDRVAETRSFYWVRFTAADGYDEFTVNIDDNNNLTKWAILQSVQEAARARLAPSQYSIRDKGFVDSLRLIMTEHAEGCEQLEIQPYYLRETR